MAASQSASVPELPKARSSRNIPQRARCVSLIGMPGSGKSTLARGTAAKLGWAFLDTDHLLEAWYGLPLEALRHALGREVFVRAEEQTLLSLDVRRCIIATGGSVVYRPQAMQALQNIGPIVYLQADYPTIKDRVSLHPERGLVMQPGQSLRDLYAERVGLYEQYADFLLGTAHIPVQDCIQTLENILYELFSQEFQTGTVSTAG